MLAVAESKPRPDGGASIEYLEGPADRLLVRDGGFDVAATPLAAEVDRLSDEQKRTLVEAVGRRMGEGEVESQFESHVATARR